MTPKDRNELVELMAEAYDALPECSVSTAMEAILTALEQSGCTVVPVEATGAMTVAACHTVWRGNNKPIWVALADGKMDATIFWDAFPAMLKASPYVS